MEEVKVMSAAQRWRIRLRWAAIVVVFTTLGAGLMVSHKPKGLTLNVVESGGEVSPYLTNELAPNFYNGVQKGEPYQLLVSEDGLNDIIARSEWPQQVDLLTFLVPTVRLTDRRVEISGIVQFKGANFAVVILGKPWLDESSMMRLEISEVKLGAMPITTMAKSICYAFCEKNYGTMNFESELVTDKLILAILKDKPFEPVFDFLGSEIRVTSLDISEGGIRIGIEPLKKP